MGICVHVHTREKICSLLRRSVSLLIDGKPQGRPLAFATFSRLLLLSFELWVLRVSAGVIKMPGGPSVRLVSLPNRDLSSEISP